MREPPEPRVDVDLKIDYNWNEIEADKREFEIEFEKNLRAFVNEAQKHGAQISALVSGKKDLLGKKFTATAAVFQKALADLEAENSKHMHELQGYNQMLHGLHGTLTDHHEKSVSESSSEVHTSKYLPEHAAKEARQCGMNTKKNVTATVLMTEPPRHTPDYEEQ